jgi:uroporphyrinogen-III decarboxylase
MELTLRQSIFWLDNVDQDNNLDHLGIDPSRSYWDITLFGEEITYTRDGIPLFGPHPIAQSADLSLIEPYDFYTTGAMPAILRKYDEMRRLAATRYDGQFEVGFPHFERGPLDILVQLRGYENAVADMGENPEFVHRFLTLAVEERLRFERERLAYLKTEQPRKRIGIADDWVNVPFISPGMYREFVGPVYRMIQDQEATVEHFHTCGGYGTLAADLLDTLPDLEGIDIVPQCNDLIQLDEALPQKVAFHLNLLSVFTLMAPEAEQRRLLEIVAQVGRRRKVTLCPGAIVRLHETYDEDLARLNKFIALARGIFTA